MMSVKHYVQRAGQLEESIGGWCPVYNIHGRGGLGYHQHSITGGMIGRGDEDTLHFKNDDDERKHHPLHLQKKRKELPVYENIEPPEEEEKDEEEIPLKDVQPDDVLETEEDLIPTININTLEPELLLPSPPSELFDGIPEVVFGDSTFKPKQYARVDESINKHITTKEMMNWIKTIDITNLSDEELIDSISDLVQKESSKETNNTKLGESRKIDTKEFFNNKTSGKARLDIFKEYLKDDVKPEVDKYFKTQKYNQKLNKIKDKNIEIVKNNKEKELELIRVQAINEKRKLTKAHNITKRATNQENERIRNENREIAERNRAIIEQNEENELTREANRETSAARKERFKAGRQVINNRGDDSFFIKAQRKINDRIAKGEITHPDDEDERDIAYQKYKKEKDEKRYKPPTLNDMRNVFSRFKDNSKAITKDLTEKLQTEIRIEAEEDALIDKQELIDKNNLLRASREKANERLGRLEERDQSEAGLDMIDKLKQKIKDIDIEIKMNQDKIDGNVKYEWKPKQPQNLSTAQITTANTVNLTSLVPDSLKNITIGNLDADNKIPANIDNSIVALTSTLDNITDTKLLKVLSNEEHNNIYTASTMELYLVNTLYFKYIAPLLAYFKFKVDPAPNKKFEFMPVELQDEIDPTSGDIVRGDPPIIASMKHKFMQEITGLSDADAHGVKAELTDIIFKQLGLTGGGSFAIDIIVRNGDKSFLIEAKKYNELPKINFEDGLEKDITAFEEYYNSLKLSLEYHLRIVNNYSLMRQDYNDTKDETAKEYLKKNKEKYLGALKKLDSVSKDLIYTDEHGTTTLNKDNLLLDFYKKYDYEGVAIGFNKFPLIDPSKYKSKSPNTKEDIKEALKFSKTTYRSHLDANYKVDNMVFTPDKDPSSAGYAASKAEGQTALDTIMQFNTNKYDEIIMVWFADGVGTFNLSKFLRENGEEALNLFSVGASSYGSKKIDSFIIPLSYFKLINLEQAFGDKTQFTRQLRDTGLPVPESDTNLYNTSIQLPVIFNGTKKLAQVRIEEAWDINGNLKPGYTIPPTSTEFYKTVPKNKAQMIDPANPTRKINKEGVIGGLEVNPGKSGKKQANVNVAAQSRGPLSTVYSNLEHLNESIKKNKDKNPPPYARYKKRKNRLVNPSGPYTSDLDKYLSNGYVDVV